MGKIVEWKDLNFLYKGRIDGKVEEERTTQRHGFPSSSLLCPMTSNFCQAFRQRGGLTSPYRHHQAWGSTGLAPPGAPGLFLRCGTTEGRRVASASSPSSVSHYQGSSGKRLPVFPRFLAPDSQPVVGRVWRTCESSR